jgi:hypothetical protein
VDRVGFHKILTAEYYHLQTQEEVGAEVVQIQHQQTREMLALEVALGHQSSQPEQRQPPHRQYLEHITFLMVMVKDLFQWQFFLLLVL